MYGGEEGMGPFQRRVTEPFVSTSYVLGAGQGLGSCSQLSCSYYRHQDVMNSNDDYFCLFCSL